MHSTVVVPLLLVFVLTSATFVIAEDKYLEVFTGVNIVSTVLVSKTVNVKGAVDECHQLCSTQDKCIGFTLTKDKHTCKCVSKIRIAYYDGATTYMYGSKSLSLVTSLPCRMSGMLLTRQTVEEGKSGFSLCEETCDSLRKQFAKDGKQPHECETFTQISTTCTFLRRIFGCEADERAKTLLYPRERLALSKPTVSPPPAPAHPSKPKSLLRIDHY